MSIAEIEAYLEDKKRSAAFPDIDEKSTCVTTRLFPHQLSSVHDMEYMERYRRLYKPGDERSAMTINTQVGVLGDIPGYGKSLSVVSLLARDRKYGEWRSDEGYVTQTPQFRNEVFKAELATKYTKINENLLLASTSIIKQWQDYLSQSNLKVYTIIDKKSLDGFSPNANDVVIVSPSFYNKLMDKVEDLGNFAWRRMIYDEPISTRVPAMKFPVAGFYWMITASWVDIERFMVGRKCRFLWRLFSCFESSDNIKKFVLVKNDDNYVKDSFAMPKTTIKSHNCATNRVLGAVINHIDPEVATMIQAGNVKGALEALGSDESDSLIDAVSRQHSRDLAVVQSRIDLYTSLGESKRAEKWEQKKADIQQKISQLKEKCSELEKEDCSICYSQLENPVLLPCCQHLFCGQCILTWTQSRKTCPMCRAQVEYKKVVEIKSQGTASERAPKPHLKTKCEIIQDIVLETRTDSIKRVIIFSSYDESFASIRNYLNDIGVEFVEFNGTAATKTKRLNEFKKGIKPVIFINSKTNCAGMNIQDTTDIILYHDMCDTVYEQIVGRANRIGREKDLTVHKFCDSRV